MPRVISPAPPAAPKAAVDPGARCQLLSVPPPNVQGPLLPGALRNEGLAGARHHYDAIDMMSLGT